MAITNRVARTEISWLYSLAHGPPGLAAGKASFCILCLRIPQLQGVEAEQEPRRVRGSALLPEQVRPRPAALLSHRHRILRVVDNLKTILAPILPHTPVLTHRTQTLYEYLGYDGQLFGTQHVVEYQEEARHGGLRSHEALTYDHRGAIGTWAPSDLSPGQALRPPAPLFKKLDESVIREEYARLEG
jgi:hypothetical protein